MISSSIYDIPLKTWDNNENMLDSYKGKVSLFINVTTNCGNAPEYRIIESIYQKYKGDGFEVVALPTNQYCGLGIVYDEFVDGINRALDAKNYAETNHNVTYNFSELVNSIPGDPMNEEDLNKLYPGREMPFPIPLGPGEKPHPVFEYLFSSSWSQNRDAKMFGNFEKFIIDRDGIFVKKYKNGCLMPRIEEVEYANKFNLNSRKLSYDQNNLMGYDNDIVEYGVGKYFYDAICKKIESLL